MASRKFPPKGYRKEEYPLPHDFSYLTLLSAEDATKQCTMHTILKYIESVNSPDTIEVNPENANFAEETGPCVQPQSIITNISLRIDASMDQPAIETDKLREINFNWMPIYMAFNNSYEARDERTTSEVEDILHLQRTAASRTGNPLFKGGEKLDGGIQPLNTVNLTGTFATHALTTDVILENVEFDPNVMFDALTYYQNAGMLRKCIGPWRTIKLTRDRSYKYFYKGRVMPQIKRANP